MAMLVDHFKPVLDFDRLDNEQWTDEEFRMELFCVLCANIERNSIGGTLKDYLISLGVVRDALEYIVVSHYYACVCVCVCMCGLYFRLGKPPIELNRDL